MRQLLIGASALALGLAGSAADAALLSPNKTTTTQTGNKNDITVDQHTGSGDTVLIEQIGNTNSATSIQGGTGNYDVTVQNGNDNTATNSSSGTANRSDIRQGCPTSLCGSDLTTNNNSATVTQTSTSTRNWNYVFQSPGSSGAGGGGNTASVTQSGNGGNVGNPATTPRTPGGYSFANTELVQYGTGSSIVVDQAGDSQQATVYQGAAFDTATNPPGSHVSSSPSFYDPYGVTDNNSATITQNIGATSAQAFVYQGASDNVAEVTQSGLSQFAEIRQSTEESGMLPVEGGNSAAVTQYGGATGAVAFIFQQGFGNSVTLSQSTVGAHADLYQNGSQNTINVSQ
jgi:hypothetical protein